MTLEEMIGCCHSGHSSTDDDHISIARDCLCSPMPDQWVIPCTLEPKRESRVGMRKPSSRSIYDRMHHDDGTGNVAACDRDDSGRVVDCKVAGPGFLLIMTILRYVDVGHQLHAENPRSVLIHCLCVLVLAQLEQTFDLFNALRRYIAGDSQQLRRLYLVPEQPIHPCQLENHIGFVRREISQELQILDCELSEGERLDALRNKNTCLVLFHSNKKLPPPIAHKGVFRTIFDRLPVELDGGLVVPSALLRLVEREKQRATQTTKSSLPDQCIL